MMTILLMPALIEAKRRTASWSTDRFTEVIGLLERLDPRIWIEWDTGAGEDWASVILRTQPTGECPEPIHSEDVRRREGDRIAILRRNAPLAFVLQGSNPELFAILESRGVLVLVISDWHSEELEINLNDAMDLCSDWVWRMKRDEEPQPVCISASDLWWLTI